MPELPGHCIVLPLVEGAAEVLLVPGSPCIRRRQPRPVDAEPAEELVAGPVEVVDPQAHLVEAQRTHDEGSRGWRRAPVAAEVVAHGLEAVSLVEAVCVASL